MQILPASPISVTFVVTQPSTSESSHTHGESPATDLRRQYSRPPVHEVIIDVQFASEVDESLLRGVSGILVNNFGKVEDQVTQSLNFALGPLTGGPVIGPRQFVGLIGFSDRRDWLMRAGLNQVSLHCVRPGRWPTGEYVGWPSIFEKFKATFRELTPFHEMKPRRVGLRYINKISVSAGANLESLFLLPLSKGLPVEDLFSFEVKQTWARAGGNKDTAATITWAKIKADDPDIARDHVGILLDIDVFNLWVADAPALPQLEEWFGRAHSIENQIFERCISDEFRASLDS